MRVNADSLLIRAAATSTSGTLNDLTTDLIMANNNNNKVRSRCFYTNISLLIIILVVFVSLHIFTCIASEEFEF